MTVFQLLFIIALVIPVGALFIYFLSDMFGDLKVIKADPDYEEDDVRASEPRKKTKKKRSKGSGHRQEDYDDRYDHYEDERYYDDRHYREPQFRESPQPVRHKTYYDPPKENRAPAYPNDPFADYRRPDLDTYIRNANERDRQNRDIFSDSEPSGRQRKATARKSPARKVKTRRKRRKR